MHIFILKMKWFIVLETSDDIFNILNLKNGYQITENNFFWQCWVIEPFFPIIRKISRKTDERFSDLTISISSEFRSSKMTQSKSHLLIQMHKPIRSFVVSLVRCFQTVITVNWSELHTHHTASNYMASSIEARPSQALADLLSALQLALLTNPHFPVCSLCFSPTTDAP